MNQPERIAQLTASLGIEIGLVRAGSAQGQFPILDLLGNLRDATEGQSRLGSTHKLCAAAWERLVQIVELGLPFEAGDVQWLQDLLASVRLLVAEAESATCSPVPTSPPITSQITLPALEKPTEDEALNLDIVGDGELLREFISESREHLDHIEAGALVLEQQPTDAETLNTIFRAFHTFKGGAGFLNLIPISQLAHGLESLLDLARQGKLRIEPPVIELILRGRDALKQFLDEIEGQVSGRLPQVPILIQTAKLKAETRSMIEFVTSFGDTPSLSNLESRTQARSPQAEPPAGAAGLPSAEKAAGTETGGAAGVVKVDTGKLDGLLDLVGEMVIAQSLVSQGLSQLAGQDPQLARNAAQLGRITKELQRMSMSLRMVPIHGVFQKMARVARDLGAKQQKQFRFLTSGDDTELDRGVVEELNDPLLHMVRNSMDHGLETAERRSAAGKPPVGSLHLRAYHQGGNIVVEIEDDGAGLNRERILQKAVERGLTSAEKEHTDEEIYGFIFQPGFSTAEKVTDISGRGVGLDVVRRNIERLRGRVDISSKTGQGTIFKITLPLTLAIIDGLIVKVGEERYIIPTLSVRESFRPRADMISKVQGRAEVVNVRGRLIPLLPLHELFGVRPKSTNATEGILVVVQSGSKLRCLQVDCLLHKQEVVIKNLNDMMTHKNRTLAGAAILGDGQVGLILDVNALVHLDLQPTAEAA